MAGEVMSVYERRLASDKDEIRRRIRDAGERVNQAIEDSVEALLGRDEQTCSRVILGDPPINREIRAVEKLCHVFVARHLPSAGHLRFVSAVLRMTVALERVGDYATSIAREGVQLTTTPPERIAGEVRQLCKHACFMLSSALTAFNQKDEELARTTRPKTRELEGVYAKAFDDLLGCSTSVPTADLFALVAVFHRLDRVSDQAQNLCEATLFELTGESKPSRTYDVLFVDPRGTLVAPLAVALARKSFPKSGTYAAAGFQAGDALAPELHALAERLSLDVSGIAPAPLDASVAALQRYDIVVCLSAEARRHIPRVPFNTVVLAWSVPTLAHGSEEELPARLQNVVRFLSSEIHHLMVMLRGDDAS
jgi:phosphate transport system protein